MNTDEPNNEDEYEDRNSQPEPVDGSQHEELLEHFGDGNYLMPIAMLPKMDCENCLYRSEQWRDGGHCYMFRDKPDGTHCGQFRTA